MNKEFFKYPDGTKGWVDGFYDEIFNGLEYDRHGARVEAGDIVIDFGAFIGMFTHFALGKGARVSRQFHRLWRLHVLVVASVF